MKIIAFNGSPRKKGNTAALIENCLEGAAKAGAQTELVNLYSLDFKGCTSCFSCKKLGGKSYGACIMKDDLSPYLSSIDQYDGMIVGAPIYFGAESGETRSFLERLMFPFLTYTPEYGTLCPRKMPTTLLYTMNVTEEQLKEMHYPYFMERTRSYLETFIGPCEMQLATDTHQFSDYSKYLSTAFDAEAKARRKKEVFPQDCKKAFELGQKMVERAKDLAK